jgi:hypothetical protein
MEGCAVKIQSPRSHKKQRSSFLFLKDLQKDTLRNLVLHRILSEFEAGLSNRDVKSSKRTSYSKTYRLDVCAHPSLPCGSNFTCGRFSPSAPVKIRPRKHSQASVQTQRVRTGALPPSCPPLPYPPSYGRATSASVRML